jgi:hypothetical protein
MKNNLRNLKESSLLKETTKSSIYGLATGTILASSWGWWTRGFSKAMYIHIGKTAPSTGKLISSNYPAGLFAAFTSTSIISAKTRGINDELNYGFGGSMTGLLIGLYSFFK